MANWIYVTGAFGGVLALGIFDEGSAQVFPGCELPGADERVSGWDIKGAGCEPVKIGGVDDHVHLLCRFGRTISQAEWVKELKRGSALWLKAQDRCFADFSWQGGYATFSVSVSNLEKVTEYIAKQEVHHRKVGYQDELKVMLRKHGVEWDERYLWT